MEEKLAAVRALYMLSFDETNKAMIKADNDMMEQLQSLQNSDNKEIQRAASGVIWEIEGKKEHAHSSGIYLPVPYCRGALLREMFFVDCRCRRQGLKRMETYSNSDSKFE